MTSNRGYPSSSTPLLSVQHIGLITRSYTFRAPDERSGLADAVLVGVSGAVFALTPWPSICSFIGLFLLGCWSYSKVTRVQSETVLVLGTLGIQLNRTSLLGTQSEFIPASHIHQVIIHEAIECWRVEFYLAMVIDRGQAGDTAEMEVRRIFGALRPRLKYLVPVWRGIREVMFEGDETRSHSRNSNGPPTNKTKLHEHVPLD
ncbi:hypothetical protein CROQUDRAFT_653799 [Cronartium quercuum f. sp. fusiforme G11]|uniref:Phosphatidylinositol N-acetylglucosaminyltransferase subunit H conserved domain-containing protein n=1 Tax=Cronartium quercuum f. sp. fusiforme G11 TaxID=708437 RepID=A0A9P6NNN8_9BASI|nr:hypothetical protein CROQUDRAFT_653799 [Cronartium quercuum f. sp. fusiforme G11]